MGLATDEDVKRAELQRIHNRLEALQESLEDLSFNEKHDRMMRVWKLRSEIDSAYERGIISSEEYDSLLNHLQAISRKISS